MGEYTTTLTSCPDVADLLLALDGAVEQPGRRALIAHLRLCQACRVSIGEVEDALVFARIAKARDIEATGAGAEEAAARKQRFMRRLEEARQHQLSRRSGAPLVRWVRYATIALVAGAFIVVLRTNTEALAANELLQRVEHFVRSAIRLVQAAKRDIRGGAPEEARMPEPAPGIVEPEPSPEAAAPAPLRSRAVTITPRPGLATFLERNFRSSDARRTFIPDLVLQAASVTRRLKELEGGVTDAKAPEKYADLRRNLNALEGSFAVLFGSRGRSVAVEFPDDWRRRAKEGLQYSTRLEALIEELLAYDDVLPPGGAGSTAEHPMSSKIEPTLAALWDTVNGER